MTTDVLVVGAGPVGLTLAVDLGRRGVRCTLVEKKAAPEFLPKMERCNARTMEIFRRMGIVDEVRAAGLDRHVPMDVHGARGKNWFGGMSRRKSGRVLMSRTSRKPKRPITCRLACT